MPNSAPPERRFGVLAEHLETLSSPVRLELLHALRTPKALHEIHVGLPVRRDGEVVERPITRQSIARHLTRLQNTGLVRRIPGDEKAKGDTYSINHERLFALVDELRTLAKLRPIFLDPNLFGETIDQRSLAEARLPTGPRLLVAYGRDDGISYGLAGPVGAAWRIGRAPGCEVQLDYDPYLSMENSLVEREAKGFVVRDLRSHNGTWVNWVRLPPSGSRPLAPGDLLTVGRSMLVFQP